MDTKILNWKEHILLRPDVYVGGNDIQISNIFLYNSSTIGVSKKDINNALLNCIREIIYNALDHFWRSKTFETNISISFIDGTIVVHNTGDPINLEKEVFEYIDPKTKEISRKNLYFPEVYFGYFLSGTNYNETNDIKTSGKNGMGAKIVNVLSKEFYVECTDGRRLYKQKYTNNCTVENEPILVDHIGVPYLKIKFTPDYDYFKWKDYSILSSYIHKLIFDCSFVCKKNILYNGININTSTLSDYLGKYKIVIPNNKIEIIENDIHVLVFENEMNDINNISFVNGMFLVEGEHIKNVRQQVLKSICDCINTSFNLQNQLKLNVKNITKSVFFFISLYQRKLNYTSQSKEKLTSKPNFKFVFLKEYEKIIKSWNIYLNIENTLSAKLNKGFNINNIKFDEANYAGTKHSKECVLYITEGLSAKAFAKEGIEGKTDYYGIFPIRGKFLNVTKASVSKIISNKEITALIRILNIKKNVDYEVEYNKNTLRYGKINLLTDNDADGKHIKGLLLNFINHYNTTLFCIGFVTCLNTPLIRIFHKDHIENVYYKIKIDTLSKVKYYKGLGSHCPGEEVNDCFKNGLISTFVYTDKCSDTFSFLFANGYEYKRRELIVNAILESKTFNTLKEQITCSDYLSNDVVDYQIEILNRNIPNFYDGLKEAQRKVLFTLLSYSKKEINVGKLAGLVSEKTNYHHGNDPLEIVIINLAQNYTGSNNIQMLEPIGQFGTRSENGKDCAAARYISIKMSNFFQKVFNNDDPILEYKFDEQFIEPETYYPMIPYYLINGCNNISSGFKTFIPSYKFEDLIDYIKDTILARDTKKLIPYFKGFIGTIEMFENAFKLTGCYSLEKNNCIRIIEIPLKTSFSNYKLFLKRLEEEKKIGSIKDYSTNNKINIVFKNIKIENILVELRLEESYSLNNLVVIKNKVPTVYNTIDDLIKDFIKENLTIISKRRIIEVEKLNKNNEFLLQKIKFIEDIRSERIDIKLSTDEVINILNDLQYIDLDQSGYKYLISIQLSNIFNDKIDKLKKEYERKILEIEHISSGSNEEVYINYLNGF